MKVPPELYRLLVRFADDCGRPPEDCLWTSVLNGLTLSLGRALDRGDSNNVALMRDVTRTAIRHARKTGQVAYAAAMRDVQRVSSN